MIEQKVIFLQTLECRPHLLQDKNIAVFIFHSMHCINLLNWYTNIPSASA